MSPLVAVTLLFCVYGLSEYIGLKSKANISSLLVVCLFLMGWFCFGLPGELIEVTGFIPVGSVLMGLIITAMGNLLDFAELKRQWKTVVVTAIGVTTSTCFLILIGMPLLGRDITMAGAPIFAGASTAAMIMSNSLMEIGREDMVVFVLLVLVTQSIIGIPVSSQLLKQAAKRFKQNPEEYNLYRDSLVEPEAGVVARRKPLALPASFSKPSILLAKLSLVTLLSSYLAALTNNVINMYIIALVLGCILTELGFLERGALENTNSSELLLIIVVFTLFSSLDEAKPDMLMSMAGPLIALLLIGAAGCCVSGFLLSKVLKLEPFLAMSMCLSCMLGFPATMFVPNEVAASIGETPEQVETLGNYLRPKMITAGFVAGTVSMVIAGVVSSIF